MAFKLCLVCSLLTLLTMDSNIDMVVGVVAFEDMIQVVGFAGKVLGCNDDGVEVIEFWLLELVGSPPSVFVIAMNRN